MTKHSAYREDAESKSAFEENTKQHYEPWVTFACSRGCGDDVRPILVSGVDLTGDFAMLAYLNPDEEAPLLSKFVAGPEHVSNPFFPWGRWHVPDLVRTNRGPWQQSLVVSEPRYAEDTPAEFDQCICIRYYSMDRGPSGLYSEVVRV